MFGACNKRSERGEKVHFVADVGHRIYFSHQKINFSFSDRRDARFFLYFSSKPILIGVNYKINTLVTMRPQLNIYRDAGLCIWFGCASATDCIAVMRIFTSDTVQSSAGHVGHGNRGYSIIKYVLSD